MYKGFKIDSLPPFITVSEFAKVLRISKNKAYEAAKRGEIPGVVRLGRLIRIPRESLLQYARTGKGRV